VVLQVSSVISANHTEPKGIEHRGDLERLALGRAFEDHSSEIDAAELPSFRPLSHGVPSPTWTAPTPRLSPPSTETNQGLEPISFSRARALSARQAPLRADARATPSRREHGSGGISQRSTRPLLLVCFFVAGAVTGLGAAYVVGAEKIVDGTIEHARMDLSSVTSIAHQ
jgi:hypothetical protein